jgi:hypothetical protein
LAPSLSADEEVYASAAVASRWLSVPGSARMTALGQAYVARGAEPGAVDINPASLAGMDGWQALFTRNFWVEGMTVDRLSGAWHQGCLGTFALDLDYLNLGRADAYSVDSSGQPQKSGTISSDSWAVEGAWAADLGALSLGLSLRGLGESISGSSSGGFEGGLGARWNFSSGWRCGLSAENLGLDFTHSVRPITTRAGFGYSFRDWPRPLALDMNLDYQPYDSEPPVLRCAAEWAPYERLIFQVAYVAGNDRAPTGPSLGFGWIQGWAEFDYAVSSAGQLGPTQILTLRVLPL